MRSAVAVIRQKRLGREGGYTLLEMAIAIIIFGAVIAVAAPLYERWKEKSKIDDTKTTTLEIERAMESFRAVRGRYPCPSRYTAAPGDVDYGTESACSTATLAPGSCINGLCFEKSVRTVDLYSRDATGKKVKSTITPLVIRGAVPFRSLGLSERKSIDEYGGRYSYAVTQPLTDKAKFNINAGGISVVDGNEPSANSLVEPKGSAHYFIFSHGPDNIGAYSSYGVLMSECKGPMLDNENCNTNSAHQEAVYRYAFGSTEKVVNVTGGAVTPTPPGVTSINTHFDDNVTYVGIGRRPIWESGEDALTRNRTETINTTESIEKKIAIGKDIKFDAADTDLAIDVNGNIKVTDKAKIDSICSKGGKNVDCMPPALLAAPIADPQHLKCSPAKSGDAPAGVKNNEITCIVPVTALACEPGQFMTGVGPGGIPECKQYTAPAKCDQSAQKICGIVQYLPGNAAVDSTQILTGGASYSETFKCVRNKKNSELATWKSQGFTGVCTCTPGTTTSVQKSCGPNMTGGYYEETTTVCPSGQQTVKIVNNTCACSPSSTSKTENCPANFNGNRTITTTVTCNNNTPTTTTSETANTCTCVQNTENKQVNCPSNFDGKMNQSRTSQCPSGNWGDWEDGSHSCTCKPNYTKDKACPAGYNVGKITETCSYNCNMSNLTSSPSCTQTGNTCACQPSTTTTYKACANGYTGNIKVTTKTTCPNAVTTTEEDTSDCKEKMSVCTVTVTDSSPLGSSKMTWQENDTCTYTNKQNNCKDIKFCSRQVGINQYTSHKCSCQ